MSRLRSLVRRPAVALVAAVVVLLGLGVLADLTVPARPAASARTTVAEPPAVPLARADAVCPDPAVDQQTQTRLSVAAPGGPHSDRARGHARLSRLSAGDLAVDLTPPEAGSVPAAADTGPVVARAGGSAAPGLAAGMLTRSGVAAARGLLGTTCVAPGTDFWFVGSGSVVGQRGRVYLTNPEAAPAVADISLYGPDGPIDAPAGRGIAVAAGTQEVRLLDALAPGTKTFAVHVHVRAGRVAVAVRDQQIDGLTPRGADWVPVASAPARRQIVAGVVSGSGERRLLVVAPGDSDAIVKLRLVSESGSFAPAGLDVLEVPAGSVADVDLAPYTDGTETAVALDSDVPVTAGVLARATGSTGQLTDFAYTSAGRPLRPDTPGVLPEAEGQRAATTASTLLLAAPHGDATVRLEPVPPATGTPTEVTVDDGSQLSVDLSTISTATSFAVTVTPLRGSGPVYAVRALTETTPDGPLITTEPVPPGRYEVAVPRVVADLSTGLR